MHVSTRKDMPLRAPGVAPGLSLPGTEHPAVVADLL